MSTETTLQKFRRRIPQFSSDSDEVITAWLHDATEVLCTSAFGDRYEEAAIYYAAHLRARAEISMLMQTGGAASALAFQGIASSVKEGDLQIAFRGYSGNPHAKSLPDDELAMTIYGQQYLRVRDETITPAGFAPTRIDGRISRF